MLVLFSTVPFIIHQYSYILFVILLSLLFAQKVKKNSAHRRFLDAKCSWHFLRGWYGSWILQGSVCLIAYAGHIDYIKTKKTAYRCLNRRAENEARTRDPNLGKVVLYQLSYFRIVIWNLILVNCEGDETRTHTTQRSLPPQSSASTNSATPA